MKVTVDFDVKTALRWVLAVMLVWAALSKIANPNEFHITLVAYKLPLPDALLRLTAIVLPWLELVCGLVLLAGRARRAALVWAMILFAAFVLASGQAWARGLDTSCGCFKLEFLGPGPASFLESLGFACLRALLLLAGATYLWLTGAGQPSASPPQA